LTGDIHEPTPRMPQPAWQRCADWSYDRLKEVRAGVARVLDSSIVTIHERTHLQEIVGRIDATIILKRERDEYRTERKGTSGRHKESAGIGRKA
jgi:hypothetical protein